MARKYNTIQRHLAKQGAPKDEIAAARFGSVDLDLRTDAEVLAALLRAVQGMPTVTVFVRKPKG